MADAKPIYKDFLIALHTTFQPKMIGFINDTYANRSTKSEIRADNGDPGPRTCIKGVAQDMPQRLRWSELLHYIDKKTDSFDLLLKYIVS